MLEIADVSRAVAAYQSGETSLGQFADWLRGVSRRKFAESGEVRDAILEIDSLFSEMDYGGLSESEFRLELANAVRPFASRIPNESVVYNGPSFYHPVQIEPAYMFVATALFCGLTMQSWGQPSALPLVPEETSVVVTLSSSTMPVVQDLQI